MRVAQSQGGGTTTAPGTQPDAATSARAVATLERWQRLDASIFPTTNEQPAAYRRDHGRTIGPGMHLAPMSQAQFDRAASELHDVLVWNDDGNCLERAVLGAAELDRRFRASAPRGGATDAWGAGWAFAIMPGRERSWNFHAATVVNVRGKHEPQVVDYLLFDRPVDLDVWARRIGVPVQQVRLRAPVSADAAYWGTGPRTQRHSRDTAISQHEFQNLVEFELSAWDGRPTPD